MSWIQEKELSEKRSRLTAELRALNDNAHKAGVEPEKAQWDAITADLKVTESRLESVRSLMGIESKGEVSKSSEAIHQPSKDEVRSESLSNQYSTPEERIKARTPKEVAEQRKAYQNYFVSGETRDLTTGSQGVVAPGYFNDQYIVAVKSALGIIQSGCMQVPTDDMAPFYLPTVDDTANSAQSGAEGYTASAQTDPTLTAPNLGAYRYTPGPLAYSKEMARTNFIAFEQMLQQMAIKQVYRKLNDDTTNGNGTNKCTGFLNGATVGKTAASATTFSYAELVAAIFALDPYYRNPATCRIMAGSTACQIIRNFADSQGRPIFAPNEELKVNGLSVVENVNMPACTTGLKPVAIIDCSQYYFRTVNNVEVVIDPYTKASQGKNVLNVMSWHDGKLGVSAAVRTLALA